MTQQAKEPQKSESQGSKPALRRWAAIALLIGVVCIVGGLIERYWFFVLLGIPWIFAGLLLMLLVVSKTPLPIGASPMGEEETRVTAEHPWHLICFGAIFLSVGLLIALLTAWYRDRRSRQFHCLS